MTIFLALRTIKINLSMIHLYLMWNEYRAEIENLSLTFTCVDSVDVPRSLFVPARAHVRFTEAATRTTLYIVEEL